MAVQFCSPRHHPPYALQTESPFNIFGTDFYELFFTYDERVRRHFGRGRQKGEGGWSNQNHFYDHDVAVQQIALESLATTTTTSILT